jgi:hypothetical protein
VCGCAQYCMGSVSGRVLIVRTSVPATLRVLALAKPRRGLNLTKTGTQVATPASHLSVETLVPRDNALHLRPEAFDAQ